MSFFNKYPNTDFHELNLDWLIARMKELQIQFDEFKVVNNITFSGQWDITKQYPAWTIVSDNNIGYVSQKPVPVGVVLTNTDYWVEVIDYTAQIAGLQQRVVDIEDDINDNIKPDIVTLQNDVNAIEDDVLDTKINDMKNVHIPRYIAHQGSNITPQNSLHAFQSTYAEGYDAAECDVQLTADHVIVLNHDATLTTAFGDGRNISAVTYDDIKYLNRINGSYIGDFPNTHICKLSEAINALSKNNVFLVIDIGYTFNENNIHYLVEEVRKLNYNKHVMFISNMDDVLIKIKDLDKSLLCLYYETTSPDLDRILSTAINNEFDGVGVTFSLLTQDFIDNAHANNLLVNTFTFGSSFHNLDTYRQMGVDLFTMDGLNAFDSTNRVIDTHDNGIVDFVNYNNNLILLNRAEVQQVASRGFIWRTNITPYKYPDNYNRFHGARATSPKIPASSSSSVKYDIPNGFQLTFNYHTIDGTYISESGWKTGSGTLTPPSSCAFIVVIGMRTDSNQLDLRELMKFDTMFIVNY